MLCLAGMGCSRDAIGFASGSGEEMVEWEGDSTVTMTSGTVKNCCWVNVPNIRHHCPCQGNRNPAVHTCQSSLTTALKVEASTPHPALWTEDLRPREVRLFSRTNTASKWQEKRGSHLSPTQPLSSSAAPGTEPMANK